MLQAASLYIAFGCFVYACVFFHTAVPIGLINLLSVWNSLCEDSSSHAEGRALTFSGGVLESGVYVVGNR